ncbi:hypothetical protein LMCDFJHI_01660 [Aeromonas salmonicida]|nr:Uncharacterized protein conserved in bacteria (DUF2065) [Aeromonas salmonicida]SUU70182.1 Uncharacterized protein conserved in bacteria (DUF2065) [Aeromonas salmonicida]
MIQALLLYGARPADTGGFFVQGEGMLTSILMGLGLLLLFEGLGPLLMPKAWQQMLRLLSEQPPEQLRRIGGSLVVAGAVILWMLGH